MSQKWVTHAWADGPSSRRELSAYLYLSFRAEDDGRVEVSLSELSAAIRLSVLATGKVLRSLISQRWVEILHRSGIPDQPSRYRLRKDPSEAQAPPAKKSLLATDRGRKAAAVRWSGHVAKRVEGLSPSQKARKAASVRWAGHIAKRPSAVPGGAR